MRRLRATQNEVALSLFPFLAVLICTMGALIVLLVVVVRNAKVQAEEMATAGDTQQVVEQQLREEELAERQRLREDNLWRLEMLAKQREDLTKQLDARRLELSHLEQHHRRLAEQLEQKLKQAASFDQLDAATQADQQALAEELARLKAAAAQAELDLAAARKQVEATQRSFALLPYDGPQGTRRRPIYVECTQQAVILQPEGIAFSPRDFSGPLGAGNPLDSALRAVREHMASAGLLSQGEEPYPLLVVRPGGSISYAAARAAMTSWDNEFGYELIDDEMKLAYGESDPTRARLVARAVEEARQRTELLRAAAPARFEGNDMRSFTEMPREEGRSGGGGSGGAGMVRGSRGGTGGSSGGSDSLGFSGERAYPNGSYSAESMQQGGGSPGDPNGGSSNAYGGAGGASSSSYGANAAGSGQSAGGQPGADHAGGQTGGTQPAGPQGTAVGGQAMGSPSAEQGNPSAPAERQFPQQRLANTRGANWREGASPDATGYNRPIGMIVHADRIEIPPTGDFPMQTIAFLGSTGNAVTALVDSVTRRVNSWGIAGRGAYWKPVLRMQVMPGAEERFRDLQILLDRSGLELEQK